MILAIDGYNVINRASLAFPKVLEAQRDELVRISARFRQKKNVRIVIFFDNKSNHEFWDRPDNPHIEVIFASCADDAIVEFISSSEHPGEIEVATDDKSLRDRSRHAGGNWISVQELMHRLSPDSFAKPVSKKDFRAEQQASDKPTQSLYQQDEINKTLPW